jgi:hypothetical protein
LNLAACLARAETANLTAVGTMFRPGGAKVDPKLRPTTVRGKIWLLALMATAALWCIGTCKLMEVPDQILAAAIATAAVNALAGLVPWAIYHAVSRQKNGLAIFFAALPQIVLSSDRIALPFEEEFFRCTMGVASVGVFAFVIGLLARGLRKARRHRRAEMSA